MLPVKGSCEDIISIVDYLKTKAKGVSLLEAKATLNSQLLDSRKIASYCAWGFITYIDGIMKLTDFGRKFGRTTPNGRNELFGEIILTIYAYRIAAEWIFHNGFEVITATDLAAHWLSHVPEELGTESEKSVVEQTSAFFKICEAADLGVYIVGRKSQPTRLQVERESLSQLIAQLGLESSNIEPVEKSESITIPQSEEIARAPEVLEPEIKDSPLSKRIEIEGLHVFIAHSKNNDILEQVKTMLDLADLEFEIAEEEETTAIPVPDKVLSVMRRSNSAVICVTADEEMKSEDGIYSVNQNVLIEIGASFVLYDKRVILVWDKRIPVPSNLQGLYRCEFEGNELSWSAGMKLMKAVNKFKKTDN